MGFKNWLAKRLKKEEEQEDLKAFCQDPNILCDEYIERLICQWTREANIKPEDFSKFLKAYGFKMPVKMTGLRLWGETTVTCADETNRKFKLTFESKYDRNKAQKVTIIEALSVVIYTAEDVKKILEQFEN